jgi:hypothetical protein
MRFARSGATAGEGAQNLLCAYLAVAVRAGLLANTFLGWWWLDPAFALGIAALARPRRHRSPCCCCRSKRSPSPSTAWTARHDPGNRSGIATARQAAVAGSIGVSAGVMWSVSSGLFY